jgi:hypothetical protein
MGLQGTVSKPDSFCTICVQSGCPAKSKSLIINSIILWHNRFLYYSQKSTFMKPNTQQQSRFIALLLVAGTIGLVLLMHIHSARQACCGRESSEIGLIKLI